MPKGFRIGQHIRQIPGMSKLKGTFGHTVFQHDIYGSFSSLEWYHMKSNSRDINKSQK